MEEKLNKMGIELSSIRDREVMMKPQLEEENVWLRGKLQERESQLVAMANLSLWEIQCRMLAKSYALYLKEQWIQFHIKTLA